MTTSAGTKMGLAPVTATMLSEMIVIMDKVDGTFMESLKWQTPAPKMKELSGQMKTATENQRG